MFIHFIPISNNYDLYCSRKVTICLTLTSVNSPELSNTITSFSGIPQATFGSLAKLFHTRPNSQVSICPGP